MKYFQLLLVAAIVVSCGEKKSVKNKFDDPVIQRIADLQDRRASDSLYVYFDDQNERYREEAALAFGSIQDSTALEKLSKLLKDPSEQVRAAAAFAIGQTTSQSSAGYLLNIWKSESSDEVRNEMLEAIGKTINKNQLSEFFKNDFPPSVGISWCLYRLGLRGLADSVMVSKASSLLEPELDDQVRLGAAHFFGRSRFQNLTLPTTLLADAAQSDLSANVRMASASALRRAKADVAVKVLAEILSKEEDYRVRVNAVRTLQSFSAADVQQLLFSSLKDNNSHVQVAAAEVILSRPEGLDRSEILNQARASSYWRVSANLYESALILKEDSSLVNEIKSKALAAQDRYAQASYINALGQAPSAFEFVSEKLFTATDPVIKSTSAGALTTMNRSGRYDSTKREAFAQVYQKALKMSDLAVIGTIASALRDPSLGYKRHFTDHKFLFDARDLLTLPKDNEAIQTLERTIDYFEDRPTKPVVNEYNHPIDWNLVKTIPADQLMKIKTTQGEIVIRLLVEEAPGSVANFVQLARDKYFNLKTFHRVVPNFVIQGGCNRGDGWGGEDYSIRSEFSRTRYKEGSVGMASAGKDTEGTQWFITHSPTPHLDGRYTIFAEVVSGMEIVHAIQVGDLIEFVELTENK